MSDPIIPNPNPPQFAPPAGPVGAYFPLVTQPPASDTFEIGLVLGGTVSAAAYTAGALDFLIEALDAWTVAKNNHDALAPSHKAMIKIASGTSGGGISAVLLARILGSAFPHCTIDTPSATRALNPLYDLWVNQIDISDLLKLTDLAGANPTISSLLCASKITNAANAVGNYRGAKLGTLGTPPVRDYVEPWLPVVVTLTNLRGIPYSTDFRSTGKRKEYFVDHADHVRFRVDLSGTNPPAPASLKPYEVGISDTPSNGSQPWSTIVKAARGTSAFPVGLPPQTISRDPRHYLYRYVAINGANGPEAVWLKPEWSYMMPVGSTDTSPYEFLCVDGGCFNNEPISYAREWLAGVLGHNPREADKAHRAVVLIDPFADTPSAGNIADPGVLLSAGATLLAFTGGARFETADLDLFTADDVYSRFLVNPVRQDDAKNTLTGGDAIATSCVWAFGGFLSQKFREHDFFLGRRNCQQFLRTTFTLDPKNTLFEGWSDAQRKAYAAPDGQLPVIPLMASVSTEIPPKPDFPKNAFQPANIHDALEARLKRIVSLGAGPLTSGQGLIASWILGMIESKVEDAGAAKAIAFIESDLKKHQLLD